MPAFALQSETSTPNSRANPSLRIGTSVYGDLAPARRRQGPQARRCRRRLRDIAQYGKLTRATLRSSRIITDSLPSCKLISDRAGREYPAGEHVEP
jgi:hypothetical protein